MRANLQFMMSSPFFLVVFVANLCGILAFKKVLVQAVYKEWEHDKPHWVTDQALQERLGFSVFAYQKLDPNQPHYFGYNRGTETGVYLKYIVDHYDDFPDVAIFTHAHPHDHQKNWLQLIGNVSPNATYYNINFGDATYYNLYEFKATGRVECGPEADIVFNTVLANEHKKGAVIPGGAGEHLSHVIFGHLPLLSNYPTEEDMCQNFLAFRPGSLCRAPLTNLTGF